MEETLTIPSTDLVEEFLTQKGKEVIRKMFYGFGTAGIVRKFDGVTDKLILPEQDVTKDLLYEWSATMSTTDEALEVTNLVLETAQIKSELKFIMRSQQMRAYKAFLKGAGLTSDDVHFLEYLMQQPIEKQQQELEDGLWQGVEQPSGAGPRKLIDRINGYRQIAKTAASNGRATTVATGAIDDTNAVAKTEQFYRAGHKVMKKKGMHIFCSFNHFENYQVNYRERFKVDSVIQEVKGMDYSFEGIRLNLGAGRTFLIPVEGMGDDDGLIGTRREFLGFGFDYESEWTEWDIQKHGWETWALNAFPVGCQILMQREGFLLVNDQL